MAYRIGCPLGVEARAPAFAALSEFVKPGSAPRWDRMVLRRGDGSLVLAGDPYLGKTDHRDFDRAKGSGNNMKNNNVILLRAFQRNLLAGD